MPEPVIRLVDVSVERDTPMDVLSALRAIAGNVELVHMHQNRWWLGLVRPNPSQRVATTGLGEGPSAGPRHRKLLLQRQGFRFLGEYSDEQLTVGYLCDELSFMMNQSESDLDRAFEQALHEADYGSRAQERMARMAIERLKADSRSMYAKAARARVQVGYAKSVASPLVGVARHSNLILLPPTG